MSQHDFNEQCEAEYFSQFPIKAEYPKPREWSLKLDNGEIVQVIEKFELIKIATRHYLASVKCEQLQSEIDRLKKELREKR